MILPSVADRPLLKPCELLGVFPGTSRSWIYEAIARGELPSIRVGSRIFIPNAALRSLLQIPALPESEIAPIEEGTTVR